MAQTPSNMLPLNTIAPYFSLPDTVSGETIDLEAIKGEKGTFIMFISNHCPFVKHLNKSLSDIAKEYQPKGIQFVAISSNDIENYPDDSPEKMKENAITEDFSFPYLYDESQVIAKAYDAACTPDFYLFNENKQLVYRGQYDDSRPGNNIPITGKDVRKAFDNLLENLPQDANQKPSIGCNIKWK